MVTETLRVCMETFVGLGSNKAATKHDVHNEGKHETQAFDPWKRWSETEGETETPHIQTRTGVL